MIAALLPGDVASAESSAVPPEYALFPAELALIARAVPERRAEFTAARHCARRALAELGMPPTPILRGPYREPIWPQGVVGSITHCPGYQAAAVAPTARFHSIGIDAELNEPLAIGVLHKISLPGERAQLRASDGAHLDRVLFSAKEAVYKTWFPLARRWLGLKDARVTLHSDGTLEVEVLVPGPLAALQGRWLARDGLILTAVAVAATDALRQEQASRRTSPRVSHLAT